MSMSLQVHRQHDKGVYMKFLIMNLVLVLSGCGYSARDGVLTGQAKAITMNTPIICPFNYSVSISLGVMRNGVGSMSNQDNELEIINPEHIEIFKKAVELGKIVKVKFDTRRFTLCVPQDLLTEISIAE